MRRGRSKRAAAFLARADVRRRQRAGQRNVRVAAPVRAVQVTRMLTAMPKSQVLISARPSSSGLRVQLESQRMAQGPSGLERSARSEPIASAIASRCRCGRRCRARATACRRTRARVRARSSTGPAPRGPSRWRRQRSISTSRYSAGATNERWLRLKRAQSSPRAAARRSWPSASSAANALKVGP